MLSGRVEIAGKTNLAEAQDKRDLAYYDLEKYLMGAEIGTPRYLAFSDSVSLRNTRASFKRAEREPAMVPHKFLLQEAQIIETIRIRADTVEGYADEFDAIERQLLRAVDAEANILHIECVFPGSRRRKEKAEENAAVRGVIIREKKLRKLPRIL